MPDSQGHRGGQVLQSLGTKDAHSFEEAVQSDRGHMEGLRDTAAGLPFPRSVFQRDFPKLP